MDFNELLDPLTLSLSRQWEAVASHIDGSLLQDITPQEQLVDIVSPLLYDPRYTLLMAQKFRPILLLLCARWLDQDGQEDAKLAALALLIDVHEELAPVLFAFLRKEYFSRGPLAHISSATTISQLHLLLVAYYRILAACPHVPAMFEWSAEPISTLLSGPHSDLGVRWLAVRCYAHQIGMSEADRDKLQLSILGSAGQVDVPVETGKTLNGEAQWLDGWLLPALEIVRIRDARQAMVQDHDFYDSADSQRSSRIDVSHWTHRVVDVHGILLLRGSSSPLPYSKLVSTRSTAGTLRALAIHLSLRLPVLLSSPPSSGKTLLINHLAALLHPASPNQVITLHLSDTSIDARSLLGSYVSSSRQPGTFEWQEGVIVRAMRYGLWLVLEDIDRASSEVLGTLIPLVESLAVHKHVGAPASLDIPGREKVVASENFVIFATRTIPASSSEKPSSPTFLGASKFSCISVPAPTENDLATIIQGQFPKLGQCGTKAFIRAWTVARALGSAPGVRDIGIQELETWCRRIESLLPSITDADVDMDTEESKSVPLDSLYPRVALREEIYLEARDVFFGAGAFSESARIHVARLARTFAEYLGLPLDRAHWVLESRLPELQVEKDGDGRTTGLRIGMTRLEAGRATSELLMAPQRPFAMHRPALLLTERIGTCISFSEPVLLVGETGTGKTTLISHIASLLNRNLVSLNLSHQTESSDLVGGFKPIDTRIPGGELQRRFTDLFARTFSRRKNAKFEDAVRKAVNEAKWKRVIGLWNECIRLAVDRIKERAREIANTAKDHRDELGHHKDDMPFNGDTPRKRRKVEEDISVARETEWQTFQRDIDAFDVQYVQSKGKFAFGFVEGPLVEAVRNGHWVLLDEINLASPETLECISSVLQGPTASIVLTEQGSFAPVPRHPGFRLFACMNPATDVGKKDLSANIRSRFTEIHVPPPDADRETLLAIIHQYIGHCALADKSALLDVAEFYMNVKKLSENRELADGSNHRPHFSMRTLARALTFTSDVVSGFGLRRALWEGCSMAFSMALDEKSTAIVKSLAEKHLLAGVKNVRSMMAQIPVVPGGRSERFERVGSFWLERGSLEPDPASEYILTPSVQSKLVDLARVVLTRRFPVLIEGPTSSGKTSAIEYLARRTGHRFVRVNNHEHTDIQEYLGTYISDPETGKLVFHDGILVRALRNGDWIVLDELNLAPTDVLEALNRLLDDNRELVISETQEVIRPHPHFMLFATQNPPGLYAGRKILSRAFRNRFLEVHFDDVPQSELQTILSERCRIPNSYAQRIVAVFQELSQRRQAGRVFETKHGFATLRDLFRWAGRDASSTQQLAQNGYMLLAERARRPDDKAIVRDVIETVMKERVHPDVLYDLDGPTTEVIARLGVPAPTTGVIWTSAMKRLFILVANALKYNEPVLLVGDTGSGKTSVCQLFACAASKQLFTLNCHQSTETADLIGGQRPLRNRRSTQADLMKQAKDVLRSVPELAATAEQIQDIEGIITLLKKSQNMTLPPALATTLLGLKLSLRHSTALFEWHDGPLIRAMRSGDIFLLDEISLADDSVLERLNSVLEPARNIVLAERGGFDVEHAQITADPGFKLLATMNPGGDYGKKELSPALRNRFTEIWVPQVETRMDQRMIIQNSWIHDSLWLYTDHILDFTMWLSSAVSEPSVASLRDLLTWVNFTNEVYTSKMPISANVLFHHAAHMVCLDGLESFPHTSSWTTEVLKGLRERARAKLGQLVPLDEHDSGVFDGSLLETPTAIRIGTFGIPKGPLPTSSGEFNLQAPTTLDNIRRLVRACQVSKPILLEGSPGVGKTSLVVALGDISGHRVCRINLSDQTDLMDLFGSDLPVEGGAAGEFVWKDAAFLRAMQDGDWVLLDEMNLAPQAVLEGLNAVLDHRGEVFIPELGRSFEKHPQFRIFAAQNPLSQGGGRKGLPKSFMDRFTKVHIQTLSSDDLLLICHNLFPTVDIEHLRSMITFNVRLHEETMVKRSFGREGSPWEFNLRDIIRWATLLVSSSGLSSAAHPLNSLDVLYLQRFRTELDRSRTIDLFREVFGLPRTIALWPDSPWVSITPHHAQFGSVFIDRGDHYSADSSVALQRHLRPLTAASQCIQRGWLMVLSGTSGTGKTQLARYLATAAGCRLHELSMSSGVDTTDLLGSFEQATGAGGDAGRFEWIDGPLVRALKTGYWLLLDNANLCSPSVLDRLNSLCETNGLLVLTERGHVHGEVEILKPHPRFRLIFTLDPRNGELSRAMRNRAIEIHLPVTPPSLQDQLRIRDTIRVPSVLGSTRDLSTADLAIHFDLLRRGHSRFQQLLVVSVPHIVRGGVLHQDSVTSNLLDQTAFRRLQCSNDTYASAYAHTLFFIRMLIPSHMPVIRRMFSTSSSCPSSVGAWTGIADTLLERLVSQLWALRQSLGEMISQTRGVPSSFISDQPFDFFANPDLLAKDSGDGDGLANQCCVLSQAIELLVHMHFSNHVITPHEPVDPSIFNNSRLHSRGLGANSDAMPGVSSIFPLYASIMEFAYNILQALSLDACGKQTMLLEHVEHLVNLAEHLRACSSGLQFDFTSASVISAWMHDTFALNPILMASPIFTHVKALKDEVSLTSGHGMQEIWRHLVVPGLDESSHLVIARLDHLAASLDPRSQFYHTLRSDAFKAISLLTLSSSSKLEKESIIELCGDMEQRLAAHGAVHGEETSSLSTVQLAVAELDFISTAILKDKHRTSHRKGEFLLELASQTPGASLARLAPVQHHLWRLDATDAQSVCQPAGLASLVQLWMSALNDMNSPPHLHNVPRGPGTLLKPVLLHDVVRICRYDQALETLDYHEEALQLQGKLAVNYCQETPLDRMDQIVRIWRGILLSLAECFKETYPPEIMQDLQEIARKSPQPCSDLTNRLVNSTNGHVSRIARNRLIPVSFQLDRPRQTESERADSAGKAWIAIGLTLLELYVPNVPLDPVATQKCALNFWKNRETEVLAQIDIHVSAENMITGNNNGRILCVLWERLERVRTKIMDLADPSMSREVDVFSLHALHGEIRQFLGQVITTKFDTLISDLEAAREDSQSRAQMVRATISGFIRRLELGYPQFMDITQPIIMALSQLTFGLLLVAHASLSPSTDPRTMANLGNLVKFPTVAAIESMESNISPEILSLPQLLMRLIASAYDIGFQGPSTECIARLEDTNQELAKLWLEDRDKEQRELEESQSLYRRKRLDHDPQSDAEIEEQEFRDMFPTFDQGEAGHPQDERPTIPTSTPPKGPGLSTSDVEQVYRLHLWIMDRPHSTRLDALYNEYHDLRSSWVGHALDSYSSLSHSLDTESLPYQILLLSNAAAELNGRRPMKRESYSFYHDPNIPEARKTVTVVRAIQQRLYLLLNEWPDQMVLHHLMTRCEAVLKLNLHSPIAKILSALEQLLLQTEDWEIYSNRENSLKPQQSMLSELIVHWRRFELSCWAQLLESESRAFSDGVAEWWFRLYDLIIRGTLAAIASGMASLEAYLGELIPLVEQFVTTGPVGQYIPRLRLLESFGRYSRTLSTTKHGPEACALARAGRVLHSLHTFYHQFTPPVAHSLAERRAKLEKELSDYIKLASWKDVNVHALKQSAQRTHRQLYKCIRKFRELLREPVAPFLSNNAPEAGLHASRPGDQSTPPLVALGPSSPVIFPIALRPDRSQRHLLDLPRTFSKFTELLKTHGQSMVQSVSFGSIDDLASQIADTVIALSTETNAAGSNAQRHKTLLMRKRKAWVDLLKELKRAGLSSRLKPETLKRQQNKVWLMDRLEMAPTEKSPLCDIASKGEDYLNRMLHSLPELRRSLSSHHSDLPTRELERAITFVESSFAVALGSRSRLAKDHLHYQRLDRAAQRLRSLATTQGTIDVACDIYSWLGLCRKLENALEELSGGCQRFATLRDVMPLSSDVLDSILEHTEVIRRSCQSLSTLHDNLRLTHKGLMVPEEHRVFDEARQSILSTKASLKSWMDQEPRLRHLCEPALKWLTCTLVDETPSTNDPQRQVARHDDVIDRLLVIAQGVLSSNNSTQAPDTHQPQDNYAAKCENLTESISRVFAVESVVEAVTSFVDELTISPSTQRVELVQRMLPFMDVYLRLVHNYLLVQARLVKSLFKLAYILCCVVLSLSTKGFCKPPDLEDESASQVGEGTEIQEGTGLGGGTGSENVSNQIEDESQVEGLRGEETGEEQPGDDAAEDGIEMGDDFEGELGDIDDDKNPGSDDDSPPDGDEQVGNVDATDPDIVDEKLWSDENVEGEAADGQTSKDNSTKKNEESEVVAKEGGEAHRGEKQRDDGDQQVDSDLEQPIDGDQEGDDLDENPIEAGKKMDDFVPEANTLDLPNDLDLGGSEDGKEEAQAAEDDLMDEDKPEESSADMENREIVPEDGLEAPASPQEEPRAGQVDNTEADLQQPPQLDETSEEPESSVPAGAQPDLSAGDDLLGDLTVQKPLDASSEHRTREPTTSARDNEDPTAGKEGGEADEIVPQGNNTTSAAVPIGQDSTKDHPTAGPAVEPSVLPNPLRSLGDTLKEIRRRLDQIGDASESVPSAPIEVDSAAPPSQVEYLQDGMYEDHDLQALGPAREDQVAKLSELKISEELPASDMLDHMEIHDPAVDTPEVDGLPVATRLEAEGDTASKPVQIEDAIMNSQVQLESPDYSQMIHDTKEGSVIPPDMSVAAQEDSSDVEHAVELAVKDWQEAGHSDSRAAEIWRLYDTLTHELSFALCEQLRLILEPTLATRLRGDYRTGKRLNMKKIIPYVASEYTKDKIWLRRTRASQREYQVLIALDDSRSMAESRSVHLAYETLALVSKALNRLESGEVAIARFGEDVDLVHGFEDGMVGDREGEKVMRRFKFDQRKTDMLGLVETSLKVLTQARERRSMGKASAVAADLWQLQIIISDGICQDHDKLRTVLRKAEEQRVMIVFIVVDSLHVHHAPSSASNAQAPKATQNSILSMSQVSYKDAGGGRMELQMERYLDTFPFQYYVVLRSVDALPDVLSGTLKQFFERISEE